MTTVFPTWTGGGGGDEPARYTNSANIATSQWDVAIDFQLTSQAAASAPGNAQLERRRVVQVVMSPMHAKALVSLLSDAVGRWEAAYGPLPSAELLLRPGQEGGSADAR